MSFENETIEFEDSTKAYLLENDRTVQYDSGEVTTEYDAETSSTTDEPELCLSDEDCDDGGKQCLENRCVNPCVLSNPCPKNVSCVVSNSTIRCMCSKAGLVASKLCVEYPGNKNKQKKRLF